MMRGLKTLLVDEYGFEDKDDIRDNIERVDSDLGDDYSAKDFRKFLALLTNYEIENTMDFDTDYDLFVKFTEYQESFETSLEFYKCMQDTLNYQGDFDELLEAREQHGNLEGIEEFKEFAEYHIKLRDEFEIELTDDLERILDMFDVFSSFGGIVAVVHKAYILYLSIKEMDENAEITYDDALIMTDRLDKLDNL